MIQRQHEDVLQVLAKQVSNVECKYVIMHTTIDNNGNGHRSFKGSGCTYLYECDRGIVQAFLSDRSNRAICLHSFFLILTQRDSNFTNFQEMTEEFQKTLRHDDFTYTTDLCTTVPWMETMVASLTHLENSKYRSTAL